MRFALIGLLFAITTLLGRRPGSERTPPPHGRGHARELNRLDLLAISLSEKRDASLAAWDRAETYNEVRRYALSALTDAEARGEAMRLPEAIPVGNGRARMTNADLNVLTEQLRVMLADDNAY